MAVISTIRNLGPATETMLNNVGIMTAEELTKMGADAAYQRLVENVTRPHFSVITSCTWHCRDVHGTTVKATKREPCASSLTR